MAHWRVQAYIRFGNTADRDLYNIVKDRIVAGTATFDTPVDTALTDRETSSPAWNFRRRFTSQADANTVYATLRNFLLDPLTLPSGVLPLGQGISDPVQVKGTVSRHFCSHADTIVQNCQTTQYEEIIV